MTPAQILKTTGLQPYRNGSKLVLIALGVGGEASLMELADRTCGQGTSIHRVAFSNRRIVQRQLEPLISRGLVSRTKREGEAKATYSVTTKFWEIVG